MKLLLLRHSAGYEHSYLPNAEVTLKELGQENGWHVETTHQLEAISEGRLNDVDVLAFATTGDLAFSDEQKELILNFVKDGKGFFGIHNATDTCYDWPEYGEMLGGYFAGHPWHEEVNVIVEDNDHPATAHLGSSFKVVDEIYSFRDYDRSKTRVLMHLDPESIDITKGDRDDQDYALAWCHDYGKGRVMYSALGHPDALWNEDWFRKHIVGCVKWAANEA
ncbi:MAG: ThuA domain-containing protein [Lentisphaeria bacterium]|nr:ThuA domain-containing protein [Lentisphaeria bacterium]NQZ70883.1 ThuA domain-containing protein [Lentisphaeria bacterium]